MKTLIKDVEIITPYDLLKRHCISIEDGIIKDILRIEDAKLDDYDEIISGGGNYLVPGFIDIHNHGNSGYDFMDSREEAIDAIGKYHISKGVTSYLGTIITSSYEDMIKAAENINAYVNKGDKANLLGVHLEGPFFNTINKGAQPEKHIVSPNLDIIENILKISKDRLKMVTLASELEGALDIISYLKDNNVTISMAHSNATYEEAKRGIDHGISLTTHLYNGMRGFTHREPGIVGSSLTDDRVYCEIIYDRFHVHDIAVEIALKMKGYGKIVLVSDAMMAAGLDDGNYLLGGQEVLVKGGKPQLESGDLAGSTLNLQKALYNIVKYLKVPLKDAVNMASLNPARVINMDKEIGSIEIGKRADLLIIDDQIDIKRVILGGNPIF